MSLIEVMISVAILATVLTVLAANIATLSVVRSNAKEEAIVQEILTGMVERLQGESLSNLGQKNDNFSHLNAWSWHRRVTARWPKTTMNPPMTEDMPTTTIPSVATPDTVLPFSNCLLAVYDKSTPPQLISPGILAQHSGVKDLKVYLEYYRQEVMLKDLMTATKPHNTWKEICTSTGAYKEKNELIYLDDVEGDDRLNLGNVDNAAVLIRVVITWSSRDGGNRSRELTLARRQ